MSAKEPKIKNKHLRLDQSKIERARKVLGARTDTETIEQALDFLLAEDARNRAVETAHRRFLKEAVQGEATIRDVFGALDGKA